MRGESTDAELIDEDDGIAIRIVQNHADGMSALEDLAGQFRTDAAVEELVSQPVAVDAEITAIRRFVLNDLDVLRIHEGAFGSVGGTLSDDLPAAKGGPVCILSLR